MRIARATDATVKNKQCNSGTVGGDLAEKSGARRPGPSFPNRVTAALVAPAKRGFGEPKRIRNSRTAGSQTALAVLIEDVDAAAEDVIASVIARQSEVRAPDLVFDQSVVTKDDRLQKWAELASVNIIVRANYPEDYA